MYNSPQTSTAVTENPVPLGSSGTHTLLRLNKSLGLDVATSRDDTHSTRWPSHGNYCCTKRQKIHDPEFILQCDTVVVEEQSTLTSRRQVKFLLN